MHLESVKNLLAEILALSPAAAGALQRDSALLGSIPELDSMAVLQLMAAMEERYGFAIDDDDIGASTFATVGTLSDFVSAKLAA
ncbi:acyl carrier protein [Duganella sp. P38]|uniref:acyl carrier protein n=1 Tax=Duganella sp. P38 TaxID=3423949 RepID=UPI003D7B4ADD